MSNDKYYKYDKKMKIPEGSISFKELSNQCNISRGTLDNILSYLNIEPIYVFSNKRWYDKNVIIRVKMFLSEHKDTRRFFLSIHGTQTKTEDEKIAIYKKVEETCLKKYGVSNISKSSEFQQLKQENFIKNHGMTQSEYMKTHSNYEKTKKTLIDRYGIDYASKFAKKSSMSIDYKDIHKKSVQTCLERYGVDNPSKCKQISKKISDGIKNVIDEKYNHIRNVLSGVPLLELFCEEISSDIIIRHDTAVKMIIDRNDIIIHYYKKTPYISINDYEMICNELKDISNNKSSTSELENNLYKFLCSIYKGKIIRNTRKIIPPKELDIYIPEKKIAIEFNGVYWHCNLFKESNYHYNKSIECQTKGIRLIHIYENEWQDKLMKEKLKSLLRISLGCLDTKIYARDCLIREISNTEARTLNNEIHLQGHRNAQVTYGLFYDNKLVQLMSFSKTRNATRNGAEWEIIRGCPGSNNIVVGGVSKLFSHFVKDYNPKSIFSYCDFNKFDGKSYEKLGMKFIGYTKPDMKWVIKSKDNYYTYCVVNRQPKNHKELKEAAVSSITGSGSKKYLWLNNTYDKVV